METSVVRKVILSSPDQMSKQEYCHYYTQLFGYFSQVKFDSKPLIRESVPIIHQKLKMMIKVQENNFMFPYNHVSKFLDLKSKKALACVSKSIVINNKRPNFIFKGYYGYLNNMFGYYNRNCLKYKDYSEQRLWLIEIQKLKPNQKINFDKAIYQITSIHDICAYIEDFIFLINNKIH